MIRRLSKQFFVPDHIYTNPLDALRARSLMVILGIGAVVTLIYAAILLFYVIALGATLPPVLTITAVSPVVVIVAYIMVNRGYLHMSILILIALSIAAGYFSTFNSLGEADSITLVMGIVVAGVMLDWRGTIITIAIVIGLLFQIAFFSPQNLKPTAGEDFAILSTILIIAGAWITIFGSNIQTAARRSLASVEDLKSILHRVSRTGINTDEQNLSADMIDIVRDQLGYTYARIYLTDEQGLITQAIAVGLNKTQLNIETNIRLNAESAIYEAIRSRSTIVLTPESNEARRGHLLPGITIAAAIPLVVENQIVGVLDVQQEDETIFDTEESDMLSLLAEHLAGTIVQARVINNLRDNLAEQNTLVARQRSKMLDYERAEERATISTWTAYLHQRGLDYLGFDMNVDSDTPTLGTSLPEAMRPALETGEISVTIEGEYQIISVPILLRGQTLGAMSFKVAEGSQTIGGRQQELIRSVVQRLGLALENKRLFEQSRAQAQRESKANEVGNILLSSTDIETVLNLAAQSFNEALGAVQTQIHLQPEARKAIEG